MAREYRDKDLRGTDFRKEPPDICENTFINCDLRDIIFDGRRVWRVRFVNCNLRGALFVNMNFTSEFRGCNVSSTIFCEVNLKNMEFVDCVMANEDGSIGMRVYITGIGVFFLNTAEKGCGLFSEQLVDNITLLYVKKPVKMDGEILGYKVLRNMDEKSLYSIAELVIPVHAKRLIYLGDKCRASEVYVKEITDIGTGDKRDVGFSPIRGNIEYRVGNVIKPDAFDEGQIPCSNGIHFFLSRGEALEYYERMVL